MGRYTLHEEKWVDKKIQQDMDIICSEILNIIRPISILLIGSFGRGEGSVFIDKEIVYPLKDYDILVILDKKKLLSTEVLQELEKKIYNRLGYINPTSRDFLFSDFVITIEQTTFDNLKNFAHIAVYDIKMGSKILFGADVRKEISLKIEELVFTSGNHVLFMKTIGLLGHFSSNYLHNSLLQNERRYLIYECGKTYIEIGTALSLYGGIYTPTYLERNKTIKINFQKLFPELFEKLPDLPNKIDFFTKLKLLPDKDQYDAINPVSLWFETRNDLGAILKYYHKKSVTLKQISWSDFSKLCYNDMKIEYYKEIIRYFLKMKFGINSPFLLVCANYLYQKYFSVKYVIDLYTEKGIFHPRALFESQLLKIFSISPLLLFSLNEDGSLDEQSFATFTKELYKIYPLKIEGLNGENKWNMAKKNLLDVFELYKGQR